MKRNLERNILRLGGTWNLINGLITILGYGTWLKSEGISLISMGSELETRTGGAILDSAYIIAVVYGLLQIIIGITNYIIVKNVRNNQIQKSVVIWLATLMTLSLVTMDVVGSLIYVVLFVIYQARNKAIRIVKT